MNTILEEAANQLSKTWRKIFSGRGVPCGVVQCIFIIYVMDGGWDVGGGGREAGRKGGRGEEMIDGEGVDGWKGGWWRKCEGGKY